MIKLKDIKYSLIEENNSVFLTTRTGDIIADYFNGNLYIRKKNCRLNHYFAPEDSDNYEKINNLDILSIKSKISDDDPLIGSHSNIFITLDI